MRAIIAAIFLLMTTTADAQSFKVKENIDALSKDLYLEAGNLKLCQTKSAGFAAKCAQLRLAWNPKAPDSVAVRIDIPEITSVTNASVNIGGTVKTFSATVSVTDINLYHAAGLSASSGNVFILPLTALQSLAASNDYGVLRITGTHSSYDFDFWRKAKAKGLPVDELKQFLSKVEFLKTNK